LDISLDGLAAIEMGAVCGVAGVVSLCLVALLSYSETDEALAGSTAFAPR
jgi:hypothetical protein